MGEIYLEGWSADGKEYVRGYYGELQAFFAAAARDGDAMILFLS